jgi:hypothetical protein
VEQRFAEHFRSFPPRARHLSSSYQQVIFTMTIAPLQNPYAGFTHVRLLNIDLQQTPSIAHFSLGKFEGHEAPPMPYSAEAAPEGWVEKPNPNTAELPVGITSLAQIAAAIEADLLSHA